MTIDRETIYAGVSQIALTGLAGEPYAEGQTLIRTLVDEWLSATQVDLDDMVRVGTADLTQALKDQTPESRLTTLRNLALERSVQRLSNRALLLARSVVDQPTTSNAVSPTARQIANEIDTLLPNVQALTDAALQQRLMRELADADLEMRFIIEGVTGLVSIRLNRYRLSKQTPR